MEALEIKNALEAIKLQVETKSTENATEVKGMIETLEGKMVKGADLEDVKAELRVELKAIQDYADLLDVKLNEKKGTEVKEAKSYGEVVVKSIKENAAAIGEVGNKSTKLQIDIKAVGNMTLGANLTGDQNRDYSDNIQIVPSQLLNFSDLVSTVAISGGTYTFPKETTSEGSISTVAEGSDKSQIDYDITMVDVSTDYLAGRAVYSKKMRNNLPFLESFIPRALRRDYFKAENAKFSGELAAVATASVLTSGNRIERLIQNVAVLEGIDYAVNGIVITPADYWAIMLIEKSTGSGYGLPGIVTMEGGTLRVNGIPLFKATWLAANKYFVGDWSYVQKVVTEGLTLEFSTEDKDNFSKNNITARIESQIALAVERPNAVIFGDFTTVA
jgi:formylmethanofuran dehydrogenase subunit D